MKFCQIKKLRQKDMEIVGEKLSDKNDRYKYS